MHSTLQLGLARLRPHTTAASTSRIKLFTSPEKARSVALMIIQSLEYFIHPDMGMMGTNLIAFPLSVSQRFFQYSESRELLWYEVIFERISEMKSGLSGFLDDMVKRDTVKLVGLWNRTAEGRT